MHDEGDPNRRQFIALYESYQEICNRSGLVDFAELLLRAHELWRDNPELLQHYQRRFQHLLVDEFQDTNAIQYAWLRLLAGKEGVPFVVGDDDQSIYRWRGARVEHIYRFQKDFPGASVIKLEQNYRSTATILNAANAVIENNSSRMDKKLWTEGTEGEPIRVYSAYNERDEADFVVARLRDWSDQGNPRAESAVLYRSNAQSRVLEEGLINAGLPYRVYGGLRFFERQEIKDALAYLRLVTHREDDSAFERIVNRPTRGIGARTVEAMRSYSRAMSCSMWRAAGAVASDELSGRASGAVIGFLNLVERAARETAGLDLHEVVDHTIHASGLIEFFKKEKGERGETRIENLEELVSAAKSFQPDPSDEMSDLDAFLSHAALEAGEGQADAWEDCVQLMTMHSAKGLEFPLVYFSAAWKTGCFRTSGRLRTRMASRKSAACVTSASRAPNKRCISPMQNNAACTAATTLHNHRVLSTRFPANWLRKSGHEYKSAGRCEAYQARVAARRRLAQQRSRVSALASGFATENSEMASF